MKVKLNDTAEADLVITLSIDALDNFTGTQQKVLIDDTTGESVNDGDPTPLTLSSDTQATIIAAVLADVEAQQSTPPASGAAGSSTGDN